MDLFGLIIGIILFGCGIYIAAKKDVLGERLYTYYTKPRHQGRFKRLDVRLITPTRARTRFMAWALGAAGVGLGLIFIIESLPK